jgi:uncharacterized phage-associated protein
VQLESAKISYNANGEDIDMLNQVKIAQMAAFFLRQGGGRLNILKLTKLLYLSEREALAQHGHLMSGDSPVSMPHGPVLSQSYDLMNGTSPSSTGGWEDWICDREGHQLALAPDKGDFSREQLDELSDSDLGILRIVWERFGEMDGWTLRKWTHRYCPEWENPEGSSRPISLARIFAAVGYSGSESAFLAQEVEAERQTDRLFASF